MALLAFFWIMDHPFLSEFVKGGEGCQRNTVLSFYVTDYVTLFLSSFRHVYTKTNESIHGVPNDG